MVQPRGPRLARAESDGFLAEQLEALNEELAAVEGRLNDMDHAPGKIKTDLPTEQEVADALRHVETALERGGLEGIPLTALSKNLPLDWQHQADYLGL